MAELSWTPPTTNVDGSPLTNLAGYRVYWQSGAAVVLHGTTQGTVYTANGLPSFGTCYLYVRAVNTLGVEGPYVGGTKTVLEPAPADPTEAPGVTWSLPPPVAASVLVEDTNQFAEFDLSLVGEVDFTLTAPSGARFDYCGTTTPPIGSNNEGVTASVITIRGPITRVRCDLDPISTFNGFNVTVNGQTKPLVQSSGTWRASF